MLFTLSCSCERGFYASTKLHRNIRPTIRVLCHVTGVIDQCQLKKKFPYEFPILGLYKKRSILKVIRQVIRPYKSAILN